MANALASSWYATKRNLVPMGFASPGGLVGSNPTPPPKLRRYMIFFLKRLFRIITVECKDCDHHDNGFCKKFQKLDRSPEEWLKSKDCGFFDCGIEEARQEGNCGKYGHYFKEKL